MIGTAKSNRNYVVHVKAICAYLEFPAAVATLISVALSSARGLATPIRTGIRLGSRVAIYAHADSNTHRQSISTARIRTKVAGADRGLCALNRLFAMQALYRLTTYPRVTLTFIRAELGWTVSVICDVRVFAVRAHALSIPAFLFRSMSLVATKTEAALTAFANWIGAGNTSAKHAPLYPIYAEELR